MSIGLFFVVFFALIAVGIIWIARSPNARPLTPEEWEEERRTNPAYDYLPGNVWYGISESDDD